MSLIIFVKRHHRALILEEKGLRYVNLVTLIPNRTNVSRVYMHLVAS